MSSSELTESISAAHSDAAAAAILATNAAAAGAFVQTIGAHPFVINPHTGQPVSLASYLDKPLITKETKVFAEFESFTAYVNRFKTPGTAIFGKDRTITAILDYHVPGTPDNGAHTASLQLQFTESYDEWMKTNTKPFTQQDFVEFLEERKKEVIQPDGARVLEICRDLEVVNGGRCQSVIRENDEILVSFDRTEKITAGKEAVSIPKELQVNIVLFDGQPEVIDTIARLRVRVREGVVTFVYDLEDMKQLTREAFKSLVEKLGRATEVPFYL